MRILCLKALAVCLITASPVMFATLLAAQEPPAPANSPNEEAPVPGKAGRGAAIENRLENLSKQLNLTDEQQQKIRPLLRHEMERVREIRSNNSLSQGEARQRIADVRRNTNQQIAQILTPAQKAQWRQIRQQHHVGNTPDNGEDAPPAPDAPPASPNPPQT